MRPVSLEFEINQPFGSMRTAGVVGNINRPDTVEYYVALYGNYQPYGHAGADFACPEGTPVYAAAAGTVLWADWGTKLPGDESDWGYRQRWYLYKGFPGIVTVIQHDGWIGVYAHLSQATLNPGDRVREGQQIGLSGGTGGVAPHLHVEALVDLSYTTGGGLIYGRTDPTKYFGSAAIAPQSGTIKPQEDTLSAAEVKQINDYTAALLLNGYTNGGKKQPALRDILVENQRRITETREIVKQIAAKTGVQIDYDKIADAVKQAVASGITVEGTLTANVTK